MNTEAKILVMVANAAIDELRKNQAVIAQMSSTINREFSVATFDLHIQPLQKFIDLLEKYGEVNEKLCNEITKDEYFIVFNNIEQTITGFIKTFDTLRMMYARSGKSVSEITTSMADFDKQAYTMMDAKVLFATTYNAVHFN